MLTPAQSARVAAVLALFLAARGARAESPARCTIPGAADWREYRSPHFVLSTDVSRDRGTALVQQLEELHALVVAALFGGPVEIQGRVHAVAFSSKRRFEELAGKHVAGFMKLVDLGEAAIVFPFDGREPMPEVVAHELAHHISWHHFPRQLPWLSEGLAQFVQTIAVAREDVRSTRLGTHIGRGDPRRGGRWAGYATPDLLDRLTVSGSVSAKELLEWRGQVDDDDPGKFHAASWLLYHWLWNHRSKQLSGYQERLANGDDPAAAWLASFPEYDPASAEGMERLDGELARYRRDGRYAAYAVETAQVDVAFTDAPIASADLHMLHLGIRWPRRWPKTEVERKALIYAECLEALREDPLQPQALANRARADGTSIAAVLRPVTVARPEDFRGWRFLASVLDANTDAQEKEAALRKAVALAPDNAGASNDLALLLATSGRASEARPFAEHALDLAPWDPRIVETVAYVAYQLGQCRPALILQRRAAHLARAGPAGDDVRKRLAQYEAKCGAVPPAASPTPTATPRPAASPAANATAP